MFDDIALSTMLATGAIFLAMIAVLNALLYKPLLKFMDERKVFIDNDEKRVRENLDEITSVGDDVAKIKKATRDEIASIKQKAVTETRNVAQEMIDAKKAELEAKMLDFQADLENEKIALKKALKVHLPLLSIAVKAKIKAI